jgi:glutathione S-transferase
MALKFFMTPGSCSTGIHILLEHLELPFEVTVLNLPAGDHLRSPYRELNPKGTIPALQLDDGTVLTEWPAIAWWLAATHPRARLISEDRRLAAQTLEHMDHVVGTVHGQGFTRIFTTDRYLPAGLSEAQRSAWQAAVQAQGRAIVEEGFALADAVLARSASGHLVGDAFSVADAALFYVEFWADKIGLPLPAHCAAHHRMLRAMPVVARVLREEGYR